MKKTILAYLTLVLLTSSCAGLISGSSQDVFLRSSNGDSDVEATIVTKNGIQDVTIPATVKVKRSKAPLEVTVKESRCYKKSKSYASASYNPMLAANILGSVFGLTSTTVEMNNGNAYTYEDTVFVNVRKKSSCRR
mgnify:FL=1